MKPIDEKNFGVLIGDVSGKGVGAALVMAKGITTFRMLVGFMNNASELLAHMNMEIAADLKRGLFITATYLIYNKEDKSVKIASAGHGATLIYRAKDKSIEKVLPKKGLPLGIMKKGDYSQEEITLEQGDKIVLCSDGISEAMNLKREEFGEDRLASQVISSAASNAQETLEEIMKKVNLHVGKAPQHDDCTLIVLHRNS